MLPAIIRLLLAHRKRATIGSAQFSALGPSFLPLETLAPPPASSTPLFSSLCKIIRTNVPFVKY
jgi:hypothetical protein